MRDRIARAVARPPARSPRIPVQKPRRRAASDPDGLRRTAPTPVDFEAPAAGSLALSEKPRPPGSRAADPRGDTGC